MKNVFKKVVMVVVLLSVSGLVATILFFPIVMAIVKCSWFWLLWYCIIIPALSIYGYLNQLRLLKNEFNIK